MLVGAKSFGHGLSGLLLEPDRPLSEFPTTFVPRRGRPAGERIGGLQVGTVFKERETGHLATIPVPIWIDAYLGGLRIIAPRSDENPFAAERMETTLFTMPRTMKANRSDSRTPEE